MASGNAANRDGRIVEEVLGNLGRLRILGALAQNGFPCYTRYGLEKATGLKPTAVRRHLMILVDLVLVKELELMPVVYRIDNAKPIVASLVEFFRKTGYAL